MKANPKRIFTHHLEYATTIEALADWVLVPSADQFLAQESINVIGVEINVEMCSFNQNDSDTICYAEVSQNGDFNKDGQLIREVCAVRWNTAPAFGQYRPGFRSQFFPEGLAVPVKEEGIVYLHVLYQGDAVGTTSLGVHANIFYTK